MVNYFKFFDIEVAFHIDKAALRKKYIAQSKSFHPDFHALADDAAQEKMLEQSTINNQGWKILSDDNTRLAHVLELNDALPKEGEATVPPDFLMEMMELNEALMELEFGEDPTLKDKVSSSLTEIKSSISTEAKDAMAAWDEDQESSYLDIIRDYYLKMKYLKRIEEKL